MDFRSYPKIELHLHLDCSLSYAVVKQLAPAISEAEFSQEFIGPARCNDLVDYIRRAEKSLALMQTREALRLVRRCCIRPRDCLRKKWFERLKRPR
jgi:adenosine deaminase